MTTPKSTIAFISGANQGIGRAVATQLARDHGYHVIIGSRNAAAGEEAAAALVAEGLQASAVQLEVGSDESINAAASWIERKFGVLDVLINNAGILIDRQPLPTRELFDKTFTTNIVGAACLTEACLPLLRKSDFPRVVFVTSRMGSVSEATNKSTRYYNLDYKAYDCSKAAVNMLSINYARVLEGNGGVANAVCPGLVSTNLTGHQFGSSPEVGAKRIVEVATSAKGGPTATFSDSNGIIPW